MVVLLNQLKIEQEIKLIYQSLEIGNQASLNLISKDTQITFEDISGNICTDLEKQKQIKLTSESDYELLTYEFEDIENEDVLKIINKNPFQIPKGVKVAISSVEGNTEYSHVEYVDGQYVKLTTKLQNSPQQYVTINSGEGFRMIYPKLILLSTNSIHFKKQQINIVLSFIFKIKMFYYFQRTCMNLFTLSRNGLVFEDVQGMILNTNDGYLTNFLVFDNEKDTKLNQIKIKSKQVNQFTIINVQRKMEFQIQSSINGLNLIDVISDEFVFNSYNNEKLIQLYLTIINSEIKWVQADSYFYAYNVDIFNTKLKIDTIDSFQSYGFYKSNFIGLNISCLPSKKGISFSLEKQFLRGFKYDFSNLNSVNLKFEKSFIEGSDNNDFIKLSYPVEDTNGLNILQTSFYNFINSKPIFYTDQIVKNPNQSDKYYVKILQSIQLPYPTNIFDLPQINFTQDQKLTCLCNDCLKYDVQKFICTQKGKNYLNIQTKDCQIGCKECIHEDYCVNCLQGYDLIYGRSIKKCPKGKNLINGDCLTEDSLIDKGYGQYIDDFNFKCKDAYTKIGKTCRSSGRSGGKCNGDKCYYWKDCFKGMYYEYEKVQCSECINGCKDCFDQNRCKYCVEGFLLKDDKCICPSSHYFETGVLECKKCKTNCSECNQVNNCFQCEQGYNLFQNNCIKCNIGEYFNKINGQCEKCDPICRECVNSSKECTSCKDDTFYLKNNECIMCNKKIAFCTQCSNESTCNECQKNFILNSNKCIQCPSGQFSAPGETLCKDCSKGCLNCAGYENNCLSCSIGYSLVQNKCIKCKSGEFFQERDNKCQKCDDTCLECNSKNECTSCKLENQQIKDAKCVQCSPGSFSLKEELICKKCQEGCLNCNLTENNSSRCLPGYYIEQNKCIKCKAGEFSYSGNIQCQKCDESCLECTSKLVCLSCKSSEFKLVDSKCINSKNDENDENDESLTTAEIVGIVMGVVFSSLLIGLITKIVLKVGNKQKNSAKYISNNNNNNNINSENDKFKKGVNFENLKSIETLN